jgi:hypothetical protein
MSMNLSVQATPELALIRRAAAFSEDGPGCGTHPPGWHPPFPHAELAMSLPSSLADKLGINPQPLPPREDATVSPSASGRSSFDDGDICPKWPPHFPPHHGSLLDHLKSIASTPLNPGIAQQLGERGIIIIGG